MVAVDIEPVDFALATLRPGERSQALALIDRLKNWDTDPEVRKEARKLVNFPNVYLAPSSDVMRLFFRVEDGLITVMDIASESTLRHFAK